MSYDMSYEDHDQQQETEGLVSQRKVREVDSSNVRWILMAGLIVVLGGLIYTIVVAIRTDEDRKSIESAEASGRDLERAILDIQTRIAVILQFLRATS